MTWLAVWLVGVGVADLVRAGAGAGSTALRVAMASGAATVAVLAGLTALTAPIDLVVLAVSLLPLVLWIRLSAQATTTGTGHWPALASLAAGAVWLVTLSGWASPAAGLFGRWLQWADLPLVGPGRGPLTSCWWSGCCWSTSPPPTSWSDWCWWAWGRCARC